MGVFVFAIEHAELVFVYHVVLVVHKGHKEACFLAHLLDVDP